MLFCIQYAVFADVFCFFSQADPKYTCPTCIFFSLLSPAFIRMDSVISTVKRSWTFRLYKNNTSNGTLHHNRMKEQNNNNAKKKNNSNNNRLWLSTFCGIKYRNVKCKNNLITLFDILSYYLQLNIPQWKRKNRWMTFFFSCSSPFPLCNPNWVE